MSVWRSAQTASDCEDREICIEVSTRSGGVGLRLGGKSHCTVSVWRSAQTDPDSDVHDTPPPFSRLLSPVGSGSDLQASSQQLKMMHLTGLAIGSGRIQTAMPLFSLSPPSISWIFSTYRGWWDDTRRGMSRCSVSVWRTAQTIITVMLGV